MKKQAKLFTLFFLLYFTLQTAASAAMVSGKVETVKGLDGGAKEIVIQTAEGKKTFHVTGATPVHGLTRASKLQKGAQIVVGGGRFAGFGGFKGLKSPFGNMSDEAREKLGLPNIPNVPGVPSVPSVDTPQIPQIPNVPKAPEIPKVPGAGNAAEEGPEGVQKKKVEPPVEKPSEEEQKLFGRVDSDKSLAAGTGEAGSPLRKVLDIQPVENGFKLQLEDLAGTKEELTLLPDSEVWVPFSLADIKENMEVKIDAVEQDGGLQARRVIVVE